ncbi:rho-related GTP-binding protein RhoE-like [Lampris incognitus]|uniref:rho-related GTP-binding protein RhoE-like n=1 Tax=Lampris incognitus TaxID=2546036 RepID=UPI0024B591F6|nr:rho-related GTP-binding protein RhoE-like [Lampris incognitus]
MPPPHPITLNSQVQQPAGPLNPAIGNKWPGRHPVTHIERDWVASEAPDVGRCCQLRFISPLSRWWEPGGEDAVPEGSAALMRADRASPQSAAVTRAHCHFLCTHEQTARLRHGGGTPPSLRFEWKLEIQEFCPNTKMLLVGCKSDLRTDLNTLVELSNHRQTPVSYDQGSSMAKQISAPYIECSAQQSENSVRDIFHVATLACVNKSGKNVKRGKAARTPKRISHMPSRPDLVGVASELRKDKAKSCSVM